MFCNYDMPLLQHLYQIKHFAFKSQSYHVASASLDRTTLEIFMLQEQERHAVIGRKQTIVS